MDGHADAGVVEQALNHVVVGLNLEERLGQHVEEDEGAKRSERKDELAADGLVKMILESRPAGLSTGFGRSSNFLNNHNLPDFVGFNISQKPHFRKPR